MRRRRPAGEPVEVPPFVLEDWLPMVPPEPAGWPLGHWDEMHARHLWFRSVQERAHRAGLDAFAVAYPGLVRPGRLRAGALGFAGSTRLTMREHTAPDWQPLNVDTEPHEPSMLSLDPAEELIEARAVLMEALRPPSWHARALCRGVGPDRWFPARGRPAGPGVEACKVCEVRSECLDHALDAGPDLHGIWGGTTRAQRRAMLRQAG